MPPNRLHIGKSGRSNSAPDSYAWITNKQLSVETNLESVTEDSIDKDGATIEKR